MKLANRRYHRELAFNALRCNPRGSSVIIVNHGQMSPFIARTVIANDL